MSGPTAREDMVTDQHFHLQLKGEPQVDSYQAWQLWLEWREWRSPRKTVEVHFTSGVCSCVCVAGVAGGRWGCTRAVVSNLFGTRDQSPMGWGQGCLGWFKHVTVLVHFISNLMLPPIWREVLAHGPEVADPYNGEKFLAQQIENQKCFNIIRIESKHQ